MNARGALGRYGEDLAARRLTEAGMTVLERNWRCGRPARSTSSRADGDALVVCEVKTRTGGRVRAPDGGRHPGARRTGCGGSPSAGSSEHGGAPPGGVRIDLVGVVLPEPRRARGRACAGGGLMGFARTCSVALVGVEGVVVEVQADLEPGVAAFTLVGLPDKSLMESRDRVRAAVVNSGAEWPQKKLTVGLSPASVPKGGSGLRPGRRLRGARRRRADRPRGHRRPDDDRRAGPGRPGAAGPRGAARRAGRGRRRVPAGRGPGADRGRGSLVPGRLGARGAQPAPADRGARRRAGARGGDRTSEGPPRPAARGAARAGRGHRHRHWRWAPRRGGRTTGPDLADVAGQRAAADRPGGRRGGRPPPLPEGPAGRRARRCWPSGCPGSCRRSPGRSPWRSPRSTRWPGILPPGKPLVDAPAVLRPAPLGDHAVPRRRRQRTAAAGRGLAGPPRRALPGRGARVQRPGPGRAAPAAGVRACGGGPQRRAWCGCPRASCWCWPPIPAPAAATR